MSTRGGTAAHPSAPTVAKVRMRFAKRGRARFSSHRDVARAMEWALRRAGVPVSLSQGFSPHPRLSWLGAAPTGAASEAEFVEIGLTRELDPDTVAREVDAVLPEGLAVLEVVPAGPGSLADRIDASVWRLELTGVSPEALASAVAALEAAGSVEVERITKNGPRTLDVRAALVRMTVGDRIVTGPEGDTPGNAGRPASEGGVTTPRGPEDPQRRAPSPGCGTLTAVVRHTTPAVRPDDVVSALRAVAGLEPPVPVVATRTAQGLLRGHTQLLDPFEADRATTGRESHPGRHADEDRPVADAGDLTRSPPREVRAPETR